MDNYQKYITGENLGGENDEFGDWEPMGSSMTKTSDGWIIKKMLVPYRTIHYKYTSKTPSGGILWEEKESVRELTVLYSVSPDDLSPSLPHSSTSWYRYKDTNIYVKIDTNTYEVKEMLVLDNWAGAPPLPEDIILIPGDSKIKIKWEDPRKNNRVISDIEGYLIYRSTDGKNFSTINSTSNLITENYYIDRNLTNGITYYYRLQTVDASYRFNRSDSYSELSSVYSAVPNALIDVEFVLDLKGLGKFENVYIKGDFTNWDKSKIKMEKLSTYLYTKTVKIVLNTTIEYKYEVDGEEEPDFSNSQKNRIVKITDEDGDRTFKIYDVWGIPNYTSPLPDEIGFFFIEKISSNNLKLSWSVDPSIDGILYYTIYRSTSLLYKTLISTTSSPEFTDIVSGKFYYWIGVKYSDGEKISTSPVYFDTDSDDFKILPELNITKKEIKGMDTEISDETGKIKLSWISPEKLDGENSHVTYLLYSTYPVLETKLSNFKFLGKTKSHYPGVREEFETVNLGENFPGYFFYVLAIYNNYKNAILSQYKYGVCGIKLSSKDERTLFKGSNDWGVSGSTPVFKIEIPKYSIPAKEFYIRVYNLKEILTDEDFENIAKKIEEANSKIDGEKFKILPENEFSSSDINSVSKNSKIFLVDVSLSSGKNEDFKNVKVAIPYTENGMDPKYFKIARLNEKHNFWQILKEGMNEVDAENKEVVAEVSRFSVFSLIYLAPSKDLSNVVVYPNPYIPYDGDERTGTISSGITFTNITENAVIHIYNIAGEEILKIDASNTTGEYNCLLYTSPSPRD